MFIAILFTIVVGSFLFIFFSEKIFERTNCYKELNREIEKYKKLKRVDFVNTGSTFAYYGIDYDSAGVNGLNLAHCPQTLELDFLMLKHFEYLYNPGATVFIVISDLAFAKEKYTDKLIVEKYYRILSVEDIPNYNFLKAIKLKYFPVLNGWKNFFRYFRDIEINNDYEISVNENDIEAVTADSYYRCKNWIKEFNLNNLIDASQSSSYSSIFLNNEKIVCNMIKWCQDKGFKPVIVNLPCTLEMKKNISEVFLEEFYYDHIERIIKDYNIEFINLQEDKKMEDYFLYLDSCRLNLAGREIVTKKIVSMMNNKHQKNL